MFQGWSLLTSLIVFKLFFFLFFFSDDLIFVELNSRVNFQPNFLKMTRQRNSRFNIDVGHYVVEGTELKNVVIGENTAFVRPRKPFGISKKLFGKFTGMNV